MSRQGRFVVKTKPLAFAIGVVAVCYAGLVLPACSSDEEDHGSSSTAGTGGSGATGTGGASTGGTGTGTGGSGTGGSAATTVTCGSQSCQAPAGLPARACCVGTAQDQCGVQGLDGGACVELNQPGNPDQSCTDAFNAAFGAGGGAGASGFQVEGCCRPEGVCGIIINQSGVNLGCVDVSRYADGGTIPTCTP